MSTTAGFDYARKSPAWEDGPTRGRVYGADMERIEQGLTDASAASKAAVPRMVLDPTGTADIGAVVRSAMTFGVYNFELERGGSYLADSPVFVAQASAFQRLVIEGNGATIKLGPNLPTTNWSRDTSAQFFIFPNTVASAWNTTTNVVTVSDANRATGLNTGALCSLVVRNVTVDGQAANRAFAFLNRTGATFDTVDIYRGRALVTWWDYSDRAIVARNCYSRSGSGPAEQVIAEGYQMGDGLRFESCKADSSVGLARLKTCRGAVFSGTVTGRIELEDCQSILFEAGHQELGNQANRVAFDIKNSSLTIDTSMLYLSSTSTVPVVSIDDSSGETDSHVRFVYCETITALNSSSGPSIFGPLVEIVAAGENTKLESIGMMGRLASSAMAGQTPAGPQAPLKGPTAVQTAIDSAEGRAALASGSWILERLGSGVWSLHRRETLRPSRQMSQPSIIQVSTSTGVPTGGSLTNGQAYEYACAVYDEGGRVSQASAAMSGTATANGVARVLIGLPQSPCPVILWRKTGTGVLSTPDRYVILPAGAARTYAHDYGGHVSGLPWITTGIPAPAASTNATLATVPLGSGYLYATAAGALRWAGPSTDTLIAPA